MLTFEQGRMRVELKGVAGLRKSYFIFRKTIPWGYFKILAEKKWVELVYGWEGETVRGEKKREQNWREGIRRQKDKSKNNS